MLVFSCVARVVDEAVAASAREREAPGDLAAERTGDRGLGLEEVVAAVTHLDVTFGREVRPAARDVDRACRRVLAEERALRSAQHFDLRDVEEVERRSGRARVEHAVDVETDARLDAVVGQAERRAHAADGHRRVARVGRVELDGRDQLLHAIHVEGAGTLHELATQHRHGDRHFLNGLLDATGRHDHTLGESRGRQRHIDLCRLASVDGTTSNGRLESIERRLHAVLTGSQIGRLDSCPPRR